MTLFFQKEDYSQFRDWIKLDIEALSWQGRYEEEFQEFWDYFFLEGLSLEQIVQRIDYACNSIKVGPITAWFTWLKEKLLSYVYITKGLSLIELSEESTINVYKLSTILRNFFIEFYPHLEEELSSAFQVPHMASPNLEMTYADLKEKCGIDGDPEGSHVDDVMPHMEVTLYKEWQSFLRQMKKDLYQGHINLQRIRTRANLKYQMKFFRDIFLLTVAGLVLIGFVKKGNEWYKNYLVNKISIYEPQLKWLDKTLKFKPVEEEQGDVEFTLNPEDIDAVVGEQEIVTEEQEVERVGTESEVRLTSWDSLPRDFDVADLERSKFEEVKKGGYRDSRYGHNTVYRVMMRAVNTFDSRERLNKLLERHGAEQVDRVKPGQFVPGGVYYNLSVPRPNLKEFLAQVMEVEDAVLYESRARGRNPPGHNKVFIWVKGL